MPRRSRPRRKGVPGTGAGPDTGPDARDPFGSPGFDQLESGPSGEWVVRTISGTASAKTYRCPGCDHEIRPATPHLVTWPADDVDAVNRRHWHRSCWRSRGRRNPGRVRW